MNLSTLLLRRRLMSEMTAVKIIRSDGVAYLSLLPFNPSGRIVIKGDVYNDGTSGYFDGALAIFGYSALPIFGKNNAAYINADGAGGRYYLVANFSTYTRPFPYAQNKEPFIYSEYAYSQGKALCNSNLGFGYVVGSYPIQRWTQRGTQAQLVNNQWLVGKKWGVHEIMIYGAVGDDTLYFDYIAAEQNGVAGMLDVLSNTFISNANTSGTFTIEDCEYDFSQYEY